MVLGQVDEFESRTFSVLPGARAAYDRRTVPRRPHEHEFGKERPMLRPRRHRSREQRLEETRNDGHENSNGLPTRFQ